MFSCSRNKAVYSLASEWEGTVVSLPRIKNILLGKSEDARDAASKDTEAGSKGSKGLRKRSLEVNEASRTRQRTAEATSPRLKIRGGAAL